MRFSGTDMYALLAATRLYLDAPDEPRLSLEEGAALTSACTILRMASDCLEPRPRPRLAPPGASVHEADISFAAAEARVLAKAASACLESGLLLAGLRVAHAKLVATTDR